MNCWNFRGYLHVRILKHSLTYMMLRRKLILDLIWSDLFYKISNCFFTLALINSIISSIFLSITSWFCSSSWLRVLITIISSKTVASSFGTKATNSWILFHIFLILLLSEDPKFLFRTLVSVIFTYRHFFLFNTMM